MSQLGKREGVIINCVALMEPKAKDAMGDIAKRTGGIFTMVDAKGKTIQQKIKLYHLNSDPPPLVKSRQNNNFLTPRNFSNIQ